MMQIVEARAAAKAANEALDKALVDEGVRIMQVLSDQHGVSIGVKLTEKGSLAIDSKYGAVLLHRDGDRYAMTFHDELYHPLPDMTLGSADDVIAYFAQEADFTPEPKWWAVVDGDFWSYLYYGTVDEARNLNKQIPSGYHIEAATHHLNYFDDSPEKRKARSLAVALEQIEAGDFELTFD